MWIVVSWSWWWSECNNHGWALWLAVENEWRELFAMTPVSLRVFRFFFHFSFFFFILYFYYILSFRAKKFRNRNSTKWAIKPHSSSTNFFQNFFFSYYVWPIILCQAWWNALSSLIDHLSRHHCPRVSLVVEWYKYLC